MGYNTFQKNEDLKAQVLSKFLRTQEDSEHLFDAGYCWRALLKYKTFVSSLVLEDEEYERVDQINNLIDKIDKESKTTYERWNTKGYKIHNKNRIRNMRANQVFHKVVRATTLVLRDSGYYNFLLKGGRPLTKKDKTLKRLLGGGEENE